MRNKDANQLRGNREADQRFCFCYMDSTVPLLSKSRFQASSHHLFSYSLVCVRAVRKPHCRFSHEKAQLSILFYFQIYNNGPGTVQSADLTIKWPYEVASKYTHGKHLLYLMQPPQVFVMFYLGRIMRKPDFCLCENKGADQLRDQLRSNCEADLTAQIAQFLFFLDLKLQACSHLL